MLVAALQMNSQDDKEKNLESAEHLIDAAAARGARLVVLPEMFNFLGPVNSGPNRLKKVRNNLPSLSHRRKGIY